MELAVLDKQGKDTGRKVSLSKAVFAADDNDHVVYLDVKQHLANKRQGTHKAKERSEIRGSRRKIKKQKGTGGARAGDIKNPLFRGGGRVFGPEPRDYRFKLNKKVKSLARKTALSNQAKNDKLLIIEDFNFDLPKTKEFVSVLNSLELAGKRVTVVLNEYDRNVYLSSKNIQKVTVLSVKELNTYDLMNCNKLILAESSVSSIEKALS
ncbi:MAG: large subunit ribosomal protein L4 [Saprospiraceae bacterium]|jgi:large subunit ribosomal protein L4